MEDRPINDQPIEVHCGRCGRSIFVGINQLGACDARASVRDPRVRAVLNIIGSRYADTRLTARLVARELGVSHEYLSRLIKTDTGHSFGYALNSVRAARARDLLLTSSFRVKEIAAVVGYQTTHHLDRYFRRRFGVTPTKVRRSEAK
jgi:transcriptional regulator GlxA family with amidase domain